MKSIVESLNESLNQSNYQIDESESVLAAANRWFSEGDDYDTACAEVEDSMDGFVEKLKPADYKKLGDPKQVELVIKAVAAFVRGAVDNMRDDNDFYDSDFDFSDPSDMLLEDIAMSLEDNIEFEGMSFEDIENIANEIVKAIPDLFKKKMRRPWI